MLRFLALFSLSLCLSTAGIAQEAPWRHGLSLMGEPKYPKDFAHFDYVDPEAPKGGVVRFGAQGSFDNLNLFVSGVKGDIEDAIGLTYDTLMISALDEIGTEYGLLAESVRYPDDYSSVTYRLRKEARFHDGSPVMPEDVIFSFRTLRSNNPLYSQYYKNVMKAEATGERDVTFTFSESGNRELPQIVGQIPVLSKAWWEKTSAGGKPRNPVETTLDIPLGSGPYRLKSFETGRRAVYERVADYWGANLNVNKGKNNFDEIRYEYFRDSTVLLEAFKGDQVDFRLENIARNWATAYNIPALGEGRIVKEEFPERARGIMQAFAFNLRRDKFQDERVRRAFNLAFDFEDINKTLFFGLYQRIDSYFFGTELASSGLPEGEELALLEPLRAQLPASLFTTAYRNPVNGTPDNVRNNLREALRLLQEAGYVLKEGKLVRAATGEPLAAEFLTFDPSFERIVLPYRQAIERLGIPVSIRVVDLAQYQNRVRSFDFDIITSSWAQSLSPGNEQRDMWGSAAAERPGSQNVGGIRNTAVDALVEKVIFATDREKLVAATKALDRVLLHNNYVVPQWSSSVTRTVRWNRFARPMTLPLYGGSAFPTIWWYDKALAEKTGASR